jgi:phytanoyl-CoA hydroxylase
MELKESFSDRGYVVLPGWLNPERLQELARELDQYLRETLPLSRAGSVLFEIKDRPETLKQALLLPERSPYFGGMLAAGIFRDLAGALLGGPVVPKQLQWLNKPARVGRETPPHQDGYYYMLEPSEAVAMWLALDEADEENGCMRYIPGSHRKGMRSHGRTGTLGFSQGITDYEDRDRRAEVAVRARPGDLLVHHCLTIHRADANPSPRQRRALQFVYFSARAREDLERKANYQAKLQAELAQSGKI